MKNEMKKFYPERSRLQASRAFTLIEMLIVLFIFSVVITISTVLYVQIIRYNILAGERRKVNQEARNVMETITRQAELAQGTHGLISGDKPAWEVPNADPTTGIGDQLIIRSSNYRREEITAQTGLVSNNKFSLARYDYFVTGTAGPLDIMMVLDNTTSMYHCSDGTSPGDPGCTESDNKMAQLVTAADLFVDTMLSNDPSSGAPSPHQVGIVTYANHTIQDGELALTPASGKSSLEAIINSMPNRYHQGTNICEAIQTGRDLLMNGPNARDSVGSIKVKKIIVFFSDGAANCPCCTQWACSVLTDPEGRAECEAAVASGEVRICPPGDPLFTDSCVWDWRCSQDLCGGSPPDGSGFENNPRGKAQYQAKLGRDQDITFYSIGIGYRQDPTDPSYDANVAIDPLTLGRIAGCSDDQLNLGSLDSTIGSPCGNYYKESQSSGDLGPFFQDIADSLWILSQTGLPSPSTDLTSKDINLESAEFQLISGPQPYLRIRIKVENRIKTPDWRHVEVTLETVISSRDYIPPSP